MTVEGDLSIEAVELLQYIYKGVHVDYPRLGTLEELLEAKLIRKMMHIDVARKRLSSTMSYVLTSHGRAIARMLGDPLDL